MRLPTGSVFQPLASLAYKAAGSAETWRFLGDALCALHLERLCLVMWRESCDLSESILPLVRGR